MSRTIRLLAGGLFALVVTVPLHAALKANGAYPFNFTFTGTALVPVTSTGGTSLVFNGKGKHVITFSAECASEGTPSQWVSVQILVDGVAVTPTSGTADAFCAGNSTAVLDGWVTASYRVVTPNLAGGNHIVQVQGTTVPATNDGWLGDTSLLVEK